MPKCIFFPLNSKNETKKDSDDKWKMSFTRKCEKPDSDQTEGCTTGKDTTSEKERTCWCKTALCVDPMYSGADVAAAMAFTTVASVILAKLL